MPKRGDARKKVVMEEAPAEDQELGESAAATAAATEEDAEKEVEDEFETGTEVVSLETARSRGMATSSADTGGEGRVIYIGRLPTGFFEPQLHGFFGQFGDVRAVVLGRNPKTGHTRHYGFVEFARADVARIAAAAMDRYILDKHRLECRVAKDHIHTLEQTAPKTKKQRTLSSAACRHAHFTAKAAANRDPAAHLKRLQSRDKRRRQALAAAGIAYDFPTISPQ